MPPDRRKYLWDALAVDDELVWQVLVERLPSLAVVLRDLLDGGAS